MRIDKYLWCIRVFKTRTIATTACKKGQVKIDDRNIKPSKEVYGDEMILVRKNQINYQIKVLDLPESRVGAKLVDLYRKDITPKEEFEKNELLKYSKDYYRKKGTGRPTKKDRRDIEGYQEDTDRKHMTTENNILLNTVQINQKIKRIAYQIYESNSNEKEVIIAGIIGNGFIFAEKLVETLKEISPLNVIICKVNINKKEPLEPVSTSIEVNDYKNKSLVLVDDVLKLWNNINLWC